LPFYSGQVARFRPRSRRVSAAITATGPGGQTITIEEVVSQIASIRTVIASGVESAAYGDKRTEFRSLEELREILNALEELLAELLGYGGRVRQIRMTNQWDKAL
jgi:hypothetical protein